MLSFLPGPLLVVINLLVISLWVGLWGGLIFIGGLLKLIPLAPWRRLINWLINHCYLFWSDCMAATLKLTNKIDWQVDIPSDLDKQHWYLLISNHQSWLDIVVLTTQLHRRIPSAKFFLKQELIWVPFIGIGAWGLDMPFMKRYSQGFLAKYPHLKGKDIEATRRSCSRFKDAPTTVINFVEGTRFTPEKRRRRGAPYQYLLAPKAGGIAFALNAMKFDAILNTTLCYPDGAAKAVLNGQLKRVILKIETIPVTDALIGDYFNDDQFREQFQQQLNLWWQAKDRLIAQIHEQQGY